MDDMGNVSDGRRDREPGRARPAGMADEVVFAEPGDSILLGARSLEGLNLRVDSRRKELIDAGPTSAAAA